MTTIPDVQLGGPRGRYVPERWVLGILDTTSRKGIIKFVDDRTTDTLIPIIQKHVIQGSEIWSDGWRAYNALGQLGYTHRVVNHNTEFVAADGTCTNAVESYWAQLKKY